VTQGKSHFACHWQRWAAAILLLIFFLQLLRAATALSATIDEGFHITSGYEYLRTGSLQLFDEHAPLAKALFAWPLFAVPDLQPPEETPGWEEGNLIQVTQATTLAYRPIDRVIVACRIPVALLTVLLAATVYHWAAGLFGPTAALFALALFTFDPNLLAHGSLATTDMGATAFIFWAILTFTRYIEAPTPRRWWIAASLLGLAQGAKLTALLLYPILGLFIILPVLSQPKESRQQYLLQQVRTYSGMVGISLLILWTLYGFELRPVQAIAGGGFPIPAASHVERWLRLQENLEYGREAFLLGQNQMHGWWQYFPVAFAVKTPLPLLCLIVTAAGAFALNRKHALMTRLALLIFPLVYSLSSLSSPLNIGYRHLLPILPFLHTSLASLWPAWKDFPHTTPGSRGLHALHAKGLLLLLVLFFWQVAGTARISPHYLAFFNELAGGPSNGWRFLADSNTDWGQALKTLAAYQKEYHTGPVKLSLFTFLDPSTYGVDYEPIAPMTGAPPILPQRFNPEAGLYAISATTLDGVPLPYPPTYDWFRHREPLAKLGHVMFLYNVQPTSGQWVAQCTRPVTALSTEDIAEGFGIKELREITFDCEQSWIVPDRGENPGWYVQTIASQSELLWPSSSQHLDWLPDWLHQLPLDNLRLSYVQLQPAEQPPFAIWKSGDTPSQFAVPTDKTGSEAMLEFLGFTLPSEICVGKQVNVLSHWQITSKPDHPISLMLHLRDLNGIPIAVGDGLGVPLSQWESGDLIIQKHILEIPAETPSGTYTIVTGAYQLDDMVDLEIDGVKRSVDVQIID
jgi:4-amino-4-deoxy-L-arabinose transferase-like glycosyltransferase